MYTFFQRPWQIIYQYIDKTGMYRMVTGTLVALAIISVISGFAGLIAYTGLEQLVSLAVTLLVALAANYLWSKILTVHVNYESAVITALIIFFLALPPLLYDWHSLALVALLTLLAVSSKFVLAWRGQHIVNPAAAGGVLLGILCAVFPVLGFYQSGWWVGTPMLALPLLIVGAVVVTKIRKWPMVLTFIGVGFVVYAYESWNYGGDFVSSLPLYFLSGPSLFLAFFMLTEPFTTPPTKRFQIYYGTVVAVIANTTLFYSVVSMTPELALIVGNILFYPSTLTRKLSLPLVSMRTLADRTYEFVFAKPAGFTFTAGQYLEWMLPHRNADSRGVRRYFTIASSPTEPDVRLALRVPEMMSTYKHALLEMKPGDRLTASQLAGDFLLPRNVKEKLGFVAGGIGITPFRSHLLTLMNKHEERDVVLFYCNNTVTEISYRAEFTEVARHIPLRVVQVIAKEQPVGDEYEHGYLTEAVIRSRTPDFLERTWYLSGPPGMVNAYGSLLAGMGVKKNRIVKDFFPGLA